MKRTISTDTAAAIVAVLGGDARLWEKNGLTRYYLTARAIEALGGGHVTASTKAYVETAPTPHIGTWEVQYAETLVAALETLGILATTAGPVDPDSRYAAAILAEQARRGLAPATEPATAPATEPAATPATTTRQAWATIREWAAGHPGWRHVTSVDADGRGVTIDWADVQWPSRADDRGWMTIDADGNVAVGGKNGGCIRATRGYEPPADVVAAARAIMAARQRQEAMSVIDTSDAAAWDCRADGDDYELISAHMREARRGRRAYDRW